MVFGRSFHNAIDRWEQVLGRLPAAGLKLKPSQCKVLHRSLMFTCYVVSSEGVNCDTLNIEATCGWPVPQSLTEVRDFPG